MVGRQGPTRFSMILALPFVMCWVCTSAFLVPPACRVCSHGPTLPSVASGVRAGRLADILVMKAEKKKENGGILDSAVSFFSSFAGIDYREAGERPAAQKKEVEDENDVRTTEKEMALREKKTSEAAAVRQSLDDLVTVLGSNSLTEAEWRDCMNTSKHLVQSLVTWVPEGGPTLSGGNVSLSDVHVSGLKFIHQLQDLAKEKDAKLSSSFKWIPKKLGISPFISLVNKDVTPVFRSSRDMRMICRDVERGISESVHLIATWNLLDASARTDYAASCRTAMEHTVVRDRHAAVMLHSAFFRLLDATRQPQPHLSDELKKFPTDFAYSTAPARAAYPFLEIPLRHWALTMNKKPKNCLGLLERLSRADPIGATCEGLQAWAVSEGLSGKIDREAARLAKLRRAVLGETVLNRAISHQLMRELLGPFADLYEVNEAGRQQWRYSLVPVGAMVALLDAAKASDGSPLAGRPLIVASNAVMMLSALRIIHDPASDTYFDLAVKVNNCEDDALGDYWRLVLEGLVKGLADLLGLDATDQGLQERVELLLSTWRMPQLLLKMCELQADDEAMTDLLYTFLRILLSQDTEKQLQGIRLNHPQNREHLRSLDPEAVKRWTQRDDLPGTINTETLFMMGEDQRTCMAIHPLNTRTQKGLMGYLLQGNTRLLVAKPLMDEQDSGRTKWRARAVARLLMRRDTKETVLFVDRAYYEGEEDAEAKAMLEQQAQELADKVGVRLYMAKDSPPPQDELQRLNVPSAVDIHPFPAIELIENGGISPYVWRDGRYGIGLLSRGEGVITSVGGNAVVVSVLFGGWSDDMSTYEEKVIKAENRGTTTSMREVQDIGAAISNHVRGTRTLEKKKKRNPWDLTF